jgi:hypothetical protein
MRKYSKRVCKWLLWPILALGLFAGVLQAQVNVSLLPEPRIQFLDLNGNPVAAGRVGTFISGTSTLQAAYTDSTGATAHANPIILDSAGRQEIWLEDGLTYRIRLATTADVQIWQVDGVAGGGALTTALIVGTTAVTFSSTPTFNSSASTYFRMTLTANVTSSTISNSVAGGITYFNLCQDSTGGRTFAWPTTVLNPPTIGSAASACTSASFIYDGTNWRELAPSSRGSAVFDTATTGVLNSVRVVDGYKFAQTAAGLQAALDSAGVGGRVEVPPVTIALGTTTITIPTSVTLFNTGNELSLTGVPVRGTIYTYTGTGNAFLFDGPNSVGQAFIGGSIDLSGAGASAVGIDDNGATFSLIERVAFNCANTTTQRAVFLGRLSGGGSGQHKRIRQIAGENCRIQVQGNGSNRVTTTVLETVSAHSYIFNITGAGITCINCTSQDVGGSISHFHLEDVVDFTGIGNDIEGISGNKGYEIVGSDVNQFSIFGGQFSGIDQADKVDGTPTVGMSTTVGFAAMWANNFSPFTPIFSGNVVFSEAGAHNILAETRVGNNGGRGLGITAGAAGAGSAGRGGGNLNLAGGNAAGTTGDGDGGDILLDGGTAVNAGAIGDVHLVSVRGKVTIGGATNEGISEHLSFTQSLDFGVITAHSCSSLDITASGIGLEDTVVLGLNATLANTTGLTFFGYVQSGTLIRVKACNARAVDSANPAAATVRADVWRH